MTLGLEAWDTTIFIEFSALVHDTAFISQMNMHISHRLLKVSIHTAYWFSSGSRICVCPLGGFFIILDLGNITSALRGSIANNIFWHKIRWPKYPTKLAWSSLLKTDIGSSLYQEAGICELTQKLQKYSSPTVLSRGTKI